MSLVEESFEVPVGSFLPPIRWSRVREGRDDDWFSFGTIRLVLPDDWDPKKPYAHDGEWVNTISLAHEVVDYDGYTVPVFEGDLERIEWERLRRS